MNKFYITTSIPYVNGAPHIGHALEAVQADAIARFYRQQGQAVFFLTGTDEHGVKIVRAAEAAGKDPQDFVDEISGQFRDLKTVLNLSWDDFIRTTDQKRHWPGAQALWKALAAKGDIYKKTYKGLYCVGHEAFITEKDLKEGICLDHQKAPELIEEENYFFRISKYIPEVEKRIKNNEVRIAPEHRKNEILALIKDGVEDISFSRPKKSLSWGIPVPGDDSQTMYVWCDALANYISALGYGSARASTELSRMSSPRSGGELFKKFWPADIHLIGKDILRFHALIWPAMLLSADLELPKALFVHGHVTTDGQKMSKTIGNVIDPFEAVKKYGVDPIRYYLLREIPSGEDGDFSHIKVQERYNGDLANGLGNFAARVTTLAEKSDFSDQKLDGSLGKEIQSVKIELEEKISQFRLHEALAKIFELVKKGDQFLNDRQPWKNSDNVKSASDLYNLVVLLDNIAALVEPFLPDTAKKIKDCIQWDGKILKVKKCSGLFPRIE